MTGEVRVGGQSQGTLRRKNWGLVWNQVLEFGGVVVSDEVWFSVTVQSVPEATPDDRYQLTLRYGSHRLQSDVQNVSGWFDILDGRPTALQADRGSDLVRIPSNSPIVGTTPPIGSSPGTRIFSYSFQSDFTPILGDSIGIRMR